MSTLGGGSSLTGDDEERVLPKDVDVLGLSLYAGVILICLAYAGSTLLAKWWGGRHHGDVLLKGAVRWAAAAGELKTLEDLSLAPHFDIESSLDGYTALHAATIGGHHDVVLWLCQRGADVHALKQDGWQDTALHYAAARGDLSSVRVLLAYGADPGAQNAFSSTPSEVASKRFHDSVASYIENCALGKVPVPQPRELDGWQPLTSAKNNNKSTQSDISTCTVGIDNDDNNLPPFVDSSSNGSESDNTARPLSAGSSHSSDNNKDLELGTPDADSTKRSEETQAEKAKALTPEEDARWRAAMARSRDGINTEGTAIRPMTRIFRVLATLMQIARMAYLAWRGTRTLVPEPTGTYVYSIIIYLAELSFMPLSFVFVASLWNAIDRPARWIDDMLPKEQLPHVDVYVVRYSESVDVLEPTVIAALNMNWPGEKLTVHVLDDGAGKEIRKMVFRLRYQLKSMMREARLVYVARQRSREVPHHSKAGNINHAILRSQGKGEYIMVLDTDMVVHPDFLQRTVGHFYRKSDAAAAGWEQKPRTAFIQTPQDFWNVPPCDPMVHCARFFYGPMLQGRDGIGTAPCCGTGVLFSRSALVSIGGQAYGSITEDYNTSMSLFASGFSSMFLNERLVYGMAPEALTEVFQQRGRWAMGALQILFKDNPMCKPGLTILQSLMLFEAAAYHFLAIPTAILVFVPFSFIFFTVAPVTFFQLWEFSIGFGCYFLLNRVTMWVAAFGIKGASIELWRGWQMWIWMAPNHIVSIWNVLVAETWLRKLKRGSSGITFKVTNKEVTSKTEDSAPSRNFVAFWSTLAVTWYFVIYDLLFIAAIIFTVYSAVTNRITMWILVVDCSALVWTALNCWCTWPPVQMLLPRVETDQGWRIQWKALLPIHASGALHTPTASNAAFGLTALHLQRGNSLPYANTLTPQRGAARAFSADASYHDGKQRPSDAAPNKTPPSARPSRAHTIGNFGKVATPLHAAASLQASALLTSTILPERTAHSTNASQQPSLLAVVASGEIYPAPAGSIPYSVIPRAKSLGAHRTVSIDPSDFEAQMQLAVEMALHKPLPASAAGEASKSDSSLPPPQKPIFSNPFVTRSKSEWMRNATIDEDFSFHNSRVSYSGPFGQEAREAASMHADAVVNAAAEKLTTITESKSDTSGRLDDEDGIQDGAQQGLGLLRCATAEELAAIATLTGDLAALHQLAVVTNSPFLAESDKPGEAAGSSRVFQKATSPKQSGLPPRRASFDQGLPFGGVPKPQRASFDQGSPFSGVPKPQRVSFDQGSPFSGVPETAIPQPETVLPPHQDAEDVQLYLDGSIRLESMNDMTTALNGSGSSLNEPATMETAFFSPFGALAHAGWDDSHSEADTEISARGQRSRRLGSALLNAHSAAHDRSIAASKHLLDTVATMSPGDSAALRTGSVLVLPVMPASVFDHSIASKPCFEASPPAPQSYTFLIVSIILIIGLIGCSFAEKYLSN